MEEESGAARGGGLRVVWLRAALRERNSQLRYIEGEDMAAAIRMDAQIDHQTDLLGDLPRMGREGREPGTREMVISRSPFILVYRISRTRIEIMRLLHGRQQWPVKRGAREGFESFEEEDD